MASSKDPNQLSFIEHLEELRWHIIRSLIAVGAVAIAAFIFKDFVFDGIIFAPKNPDFVTYRAFCWLSHQIFLGDRLCMEGIDFEIQNVDMAGLFLTHIKVSFVAGIVVAFPFIFWEFWKFIRPGLYEKEVKHSRGLVLVCSVLFFFGVMFGYFLIVPFSVNFLGNYNLSAEVTNRPNLGSYISVITMIALASGIIFELPVVSYLLSKIGLLTPEWLKTYRKHAFIAILTVAAIITPPDITSQVLIAIPILLLYEVSIIISRKVNKKREEELK